MRNIRQQIRSYVAAIRANAMKEVGVPGWIEIGSIYNINHPTKLTEWNRINYVGKDDRDWYDVDDDPDDWHVNGNVQEYLMGVFGEE